MDMLTIDEEYGERWLRIMRDLVARDLDAATFTTERMAALKVWTRERKHAQAQLHWKYDNTGRRKPALVERDIERAWKTLEQRTEQLRAQVEAAAEERAAQREAHVQSTKRIRDNLQVVRDVAQRQPVREVTDRDKAIALIRSTLQLDADEEVTDYELSLFLDVARDRMTTQERVQFIHLVRPDLVRA